jgi:uncharacterized HAD superfamily protein
MNKPVIAIDIDDVLALSAQGFVDFSNETWDTRLKVSDYDEDWARMWTLDHEATRKRAHTIYESDVVGKFKHIEGAESVLRKLKKHFKLVITTSRVSNVHSLTLKWIDTYYRDLFDEIHLAGFYEGVKEGAHTLTKGDLYKQIGANYVIDDHPKHCLAAAENGIETLLFGDYPWNNLETYPDLIHKVHTWQEVQEFFDGRS